jgi:hypothetical protein
MFVSSRIFNVIIAQRALQRDWGGKIVGKFLKPAERGG